MSEFDPLGESGESVLQEIRYLTYRTADSARVFGTDHTEPRKLEDWLQLEDDKGDHVILISFESRNIHLSQHNLERLVTKWNVPGATMRHLLNSIGGNHIQKTYQGYLWKSWTITMATELLTNPTSFFAIGFATNQPTAPLRVLAFVDTARREQVETIIRAFVSADHGAASADLKSLWMQSLFIAASVQGWNDWSATFIKWAQTELAALRQARTSVSDCENMARSIDCQSEAKVSIAYLNALRAHANYIAGAAQQQPPETTHIELQNVTCEIVNNSRKHFGDILRKSMVFREVLEAELQLCMMSVQINSLGYVRHNVVTLNSVASSSQKQAEKMQQYAEHARQDTRHMRRLAFLTMCYLPTTTIAAIFSMPFLGLDDDLRFNALGKLWIFVVLSVALTALTFMISFSWEKFSHKENKEQKKTV